MQISGQKLEPLSAAWSIIVAYVPWTLVYGLIYVLQGAVDHKSRYEILKMAFGTSVSATLCPRKQFL